MSSKRTKSCKEARELAATKWSDERCRPPILAKTPNQETYIKALKNKLKFFEKILFVECNHINKYSRGWNNDKIMILKKKN